MKWTDNEVQIFIFWRRKGNKGERTTDKLVEHIWESLPHIICIYSDLNTCLWTLRCGERRQLLDLWSSKNGGSVEKNGTCLTNKTKVKGWKDTSTESYSVLHGRYIPVMSGILISQDFLCNWKETLGEPTIFWVGAPPLPPPSPQRHQTGINNV